MYNELDMIISEYVGYNESGNDVEGPSDDCADPVLLMNITDECSMHIKGDLPTNKMSTDAQYCITEWEEMMKDQPASGQYQYELNFIEKEKRQCQKKSLVKSLKLIIKKLL